MCTLAECLNVLDGFLLPALDDPDWLRDLREHLCHRRLPGLSRFDPTQGPCHWWDINWVLQFYLARQPALGSRALNGQFSVVNAMFLLKFRGEQLELELIKHELLN